MGKLTIEAIAGCVIIYRVCDPSQIFMERKSDNYPLRVFRKHLCPFGGKWGGNEAKKDRNTKDTVIRELTEELEFSPLALPHPADIKHFADLKATIVNQLVPFGDFLLNIPAAVFQKADPESKRPDWVSLASYWIAGLSDADWATLKTLQSIYGNLCNEGASTLVSLNKILETGIPFSWGSDRVIKAFWLRQGIEIASCLPLLPGIGVWRLRNEPLGSYREYLDYYDVSHKPSRPSM